MKYLAFTLMLFPASAMAQTGTNARGEPAACVKPDPRLIAVQNGDAGSRFGDGRISRKYDEQVKAFNDCTRSYLDRADTEISRLRIETKARQEQIAQSATDRIHRMERQIADAAQAIRTVQAWQKPSPATPSGTLDAFPDPECREPDSRLLEVRRGTKDDGARARQYDGQIKDYAGCMQLWIAQAGNEISQIKSDAESELKSLTTNANRRILALSTATQDAAKQADIVQQQQETAIAALQTSLGAGSAATDVLQGGSQNQLQAKLQRSQDMPTGAGDPDAITCRTRQQLADSRLTGPEVCKRNRDWAELYKVGKTISADGQRIVNSEKAVTLGPATDGR